MTVVFGILVGAGSFEIAITIIAIEGAMTSRMLCLRLPPFSSSGPRDSRTISQTPLNALFASRTCRCSPFPQHCRPLPLPPRDVATGGTWQKLRSAAVTASHDAFFFSIFIG